MITDASFIGCENLPPESTKRKTMLPSERFGSMGHRGKTMNEPNDVADGSIASNCSSSASPQDMADELRKKGWWQKRIGIWVSPTGQLFRGPVEAYRIMKSNDPGFPDSSTV